MSPEGDIIKEFQQWGSFCGVRDRVEREPADEILKSRDPVPNLLKGLRASPERRPDVSKSA